MSTTYDNRILHQAIHVYCMCAIICFANLSLTLEIYLYLFHNKPHSTAKRKKSGTGRTRYVPHLCQKVLLLLIKEYR